MKPVTSDVMRQLDLEASEHFGITSLQLMENAGRAVCEEIIKDYCPCAVLVVTGKGNNAGDGFTAARYLIQRGFRVHVLMLSAPDRLSGDALTNYKLLTRFDAEFHHLESMDFSNGIAPLLKSVSVVIDAVFGFGIKGVLRGIYVAVINTINLSGKPVYCIDVPSGLDPDSGEVCGTALKASVTVALGLPKAGFYLASGPEFAGEVRIVDIGHPMELVSPFLN